MPPPSANDQTPDSSTISESCEVLSDEVRRQVLYYLRECGGTTTVEALRAHLSEQRGSSTADVGAVLGHVALPKLDDYGVIEYDVDRGRVRYAGSSLTTELLEWIEERERTEN